MNGSFLLDTNVVTALFANDSGIEQQLAAARHVFVPCIVLGELYYGALKSARRDENTARVDEFADANVVIPCTPATAREYGKLKNNLRSKGRPIPENDIWIAAIAIEHGLTLVSRDQHFREVEGLALTVW